MDRKYFDFSWYMFGKKKRKFDLNKFIIILLSH